MNFGWGSLPWHLLDDILNKVKTQQDYLEFDLVCASWHQIAMTDKQRSRINTLPRVPMLLVPSKENHSHSLYNVVTKRFSESKLVVPHEGRFASFSRGWLVAIEKDLSVTLYKAYPTLINNKDDIKAPTTIRLPIIDSDDDIDDGNYYLDYEIRRAVISADPLTNPNECIVMVIFGGLVKTVFIRPNKDTHWTRAFTPYFSDILYRNDRFYAVNGLGKLFSFKVTKDTTNYLHDMKQIARQNQYPDLCPGNVYLAESHGELLLVRRGLKWREVRKRRRKWTKYRSKYDDIDFIHHTRKTRGVYLFKLDLEKGKWVKIENLSDVLLFLGDNASISISCSDFPRCKPDRVYLTHDGDGLLCTLCQVDDFGEYDLEYGMIPHFGMDATKATDIFPKIPIWFVPNSR